MGNSLKIGNSLRIGNTLIIGNSELETHSELGRHSELQALRVKNTLRFATHNWDLRILNSLRI